MVFQTPKPYLQEGANCKWATGACNLLKVSRDAPFLQNRAVIDGIWASLETGVCQPTKKMPCILQSIQTSQSLCLTFRRAI